MGNPLAFRRRLQEACDTLGDHARVSLIRPYGARAALPSHLYPEVSQAGAARGGWDRGARLDSGDLSNAGHRDPAGHIRPDHVHLLLSVAPHLAPSRVMQAIKGKTSHHLLQDHRRLRAEFWGRHLWAPGDFVASPGNVTDETIAEYIRLQGAEAQDDDRFRITES